jgi:hypothetical protein
VARSTPTAVGCRPCATRRRPIPTDDIRYEAFLPQHTPSKHRVMAIASTPGHTELSAVATVGDALTATQLADALNSRLLGRRNHAQRLNTALACLPDTAQAAIQQLPSTPSFPHAAEPRWPHTCPPTR